MVYVFFLWQCENEIKSLRSKLLLSNEDNDDEKVEREDGEVESDEDDDDDEPTLVSRSKHFAKQVT